MYLEKAVWKYLKKKQNLRLDLTITGCTRYDMYGEVASDSEEEVDVDCSSTALHLDDWLRFKVDPEVCQKVTWKILILIYEVVNNDIL